LPHYNCQRSQQQFEFRNVSGAVFAAFIRAQVCSLMRNQCVGNRLVAFTNLKSRNPLEMPIFESANHVTLLAGFLTFVVYTQRRVPDTEKVNGYKEEVQEKSF
jgi:hypothetical protein